MQGAQAFDFVVNLPCLHRTTAGTIDAQDDAFGMFVFECGLQAFDHAFGASLIAGRDHALQIHERGMCFSAGQVGAVHQSHHHNQNEGQINKADDFEKDAPFACPALLGDRSQRDFFQGLTFPIFRFSHAINFLRLDRRCRRVLE